MPVSVPPTLCRLLLCDIFSIYVTVHHLTIYKLSLKLLYHSKNQADKKVLC